jgi:hypothetical protein
MELIITPTQALVPLSVLFIAYHAIRALFFGKPESKHWEELPVVGLKDGWLKWVWATLKSVRYTQDWAFQGYRKVWTFLRSLDDRMLTISLPVC